MPRKTATEPKEPKENAGRKAAKNGEPSAPTRGRPRAAKGGAAPGDDLGAADLTRKVAESLRQFRQERGLSLDDLATRSGVSRAALSQIEGRKTNPTLSVLWKIAVGLGVPFNDLLGPRGDASVLVLRAGDTQPLRSADGRTESRLLSPGGSATGNEVYELRLLPRAVHASDAHARGTQETVIVLAGNLRLVVDGVTEELAAGDSAFFRADVPHSYQNPEAREVRFLNVIHYVRG